MVVRFPRPSPAEAWRMRGYSENWQIGNNLRFARDCFRVVQPEVGLGCTEHDMADLDTGPQSGWRVGTLYTGLDRESGDIESMNYVVLLEDEDSEVKINYWILKGEAEARADDHRKR
jgi:hypothetical protein